MDEEYEWEEFADMAIAESKAFLHTEKRLVKNHHKLIDRLQAWDHIFAHLDERLPAESHLHELFGEIRVKLLEIDQLVTEGRLKELRLMKEEKRDIKMLRRDVKHRNWKAVKQDVQAETEEEREVKDLQMEELQELHERFRELTGLLEGSELKTAIDEDLGKPKEKHEFEDKVHYYLVQMHRFFAVYETVFRHLWEKEKLKNPA
ncbi:MAG: hypothetical protein KJ709_02545 [Nanoarchaeota archaeon]|nr:hypothetical protein [Nanoarchaeota archaeon]